MFARFTAPLACAACIGCGSGLEDTDIDLSDPIEVGSLEISWSFERQDGGEATCDQVNVSATLVSFGGADQVRVECGDEQRFLMGGLMVGRIPVTLLALGTDGRTVEEFFGQADIVQDQTTRIEHTFAVSGSGVSTGDLLIRWEIDERPASTQCAEVGGVSARIRTLDASIDAFDRTVPCTDGALRLDEQRSGFYEVVVDILDANGASINLGVGDVDVPINQLAVMDVDVFVQAIEPASLEAIWTVDGAPPEDLCAALSIEEAELELQELRLQGLRFETVATATTSCGAGSYRFAGLRATGTRRVGVFLIDTSIDRIVITSSVSNPTSLMAGQTSTVTVDLAPPP